MRNYPYFLLCSFAFLALLLTGCGDPKTENISATVEALVEALSLENTSLAVAALEKTGASMDDAQLTRVLQEAQKLTVNPQWILFFEAFHTYYNIPQAAYLLAESNCRAGNTETGMKVLGDAIPSSLRDEALLHRAAALAYTQKRMEEARRWLEQLLNVNPQNIDGLFLRGMILSRDAKFDEARADLQCVYDLQPNHRLAEYELGVLEERAGANEKAERLMRSVVQKQPFFTEAYKGLLSTLIKQGKRDEVNKYEKIVNALDSWTPEKIKNAWFAFNNPDSIPPQSALELAMDLSLVGRDDLGKHYLTRQIEQGKSNEDMLMLLAQIQQNCKEYEDCLKTLDKIVSPERRQSELYATFKAWSLFQIGDYAECKAFYQEMLPLHKESPHFIDLKKAMDEKGI
jgi:tetratricopeptide (TPR) repeat protein